MCFSDAVNLAKVNNLFDDDEFSGLRIAKATRERRRGVKANLFTPLHFLCIISEQG